MRSLHTRQRTQLLVLSTFVLVTAVMLVPFRLASVVGHGYPGVEALSDAVSAGFVDFWHTDTGRLNPVLQTAVDYWARFHLIKAVLAGLLLLVLVSLGARLWASFARADGVGRRVLLALAGCLHALLTTLTLLVLVANVQGALAPLSSALGLMPLGNPDPELARTLKQARHGLVSGHESAASQALVNDFARYHLVMGGIGAVTSVALVAAAVMLGVRWRKVGGVRLLVGAGALLMLAAFFGVVALANFSTAGHPAQSLADFFAGGL